MTAEATVVCGEPGVAPLVVNPVVAARLNGRRYHLFYDLFVHHDRRKLTAVAPYYGEDFDFHAHGVAPQGPHQVIDLPGGRARDVGGHDHRPHARSTRRRGSYKLGKNDPTRTFGIATSTSPAGVDNALGRDPLR